MAKWSIDNVIVHNNDPKYNFNQSHLSVNPTTDDNVHKVIKDSDDGTIVQLDFEQGQTIDNPTDDDNVRQIINKDGLDLDKVTIIDLYSCKLITDEALKIIAQKCSRLEKLFVGECVNVTDEGIRSILTSNPNLKVLYFMYCKKVMVDIINAIITHTPNMTHIHARGIGWSVIPDDIDFGKLNKLEVFDIHGNKIKKLPKSMANLPHNCEIRIGGNPLESPPPIGRRIDKFGNMTPATIARFYAEEMCKQPGFTLQMMDNHIEKCGVKDIDGLQEICQGMRSIIRSKIEQELKCRFETGVHGTSSCCP